MLYFVMFVVFSIISGSVEKAHNVVSVHCHDITCCGVAFSDGGKWLCAGDLTGGVWVMEENNSESLYNCSVNNI